MDFYRYYYLNEYRFFLFLFLFLIITRLIFTLIFRYIIIKTHYPGISDIFEIFLSRLHIVHLSHLFFKSCTPVKLCENDIGRVPICRRMHGDNMYGATNFSRRDFEREFFLFRKLFSRKPDTDIFLSGDSTKVSIYTCRSSHDAIIGESMREETDVANDFFFNRKLVLCRDSNLVINTTFLWNLFSLFVEK